MAIWRVWILNRLSSFCIAPKTLNPKPWFSFLLDLLPRKVFYYFRKRHTFWGMPLVSLANPMQSNIVWCVHIAQCRSIYFRHIFLKEKNCTWYKEISNCQLISCHLSWFVYIQTFKCVDMIKDMSNWLHEEDSFGQENSARISFIIAEWY